MLIKKIVSFAITSGFILAVAAHSIAQDATSQAATAQASPDPQQQQEEKAKLERKANALLEQVINEAQSLKLPENRIRVSIAAGDMLWDKNPVRARGLFVDAGAALAQMNVDVDRTDRNEMQSVNQLRQELVLGAGRHDAELGYQLLRATQPPSAGANTGGRRQRPGFDQSSALEQNLLTVIAAMDPKVAYQKTVEALDKGEYPNAVARVLAQLQAKDKDAFDKLSSKVLNKLNADNLTASREAGNLAMNLLRPGPRPTENSTGNSANNTTAADPTKVSNQVLNESSYHDLLDAAVTAALTAQRPAPGTNSGGNMTVTNIVGSGGRFRGGPQVVQTGPLDDAQVQQNNARGLLMQMQMILPMVDQYLPDRAQSVRQKLTELGMNNNLMASMSQMTSAMQQNTSDSLLTAAGVAPPQMQPRLYQQAAQRAIDEGNPDRAMQIASDHLDESARNSIMQSVDFKRAAINPTPEKLAEIRQKLAALPSDSERVKALIELSVTTRKDNPKLALRFMDDARTLVSRKAASYSDFEDQIKVADAYSALDAKKSFEVLEPGIAQLNELLSAAEVLNGFEVEVFKDGELSLRGDSDLVGMVARYGQELAALAKVDFDHARMTADRFLLPEPRLNAKLSIVQSALGMQPLVNNNNGRQNLRFVTR